MPSHRILLLLAAVICGLAAIAPAGGQTRPALSVPAMPGPDARVPLLTPHELARWTAVPGPVLIVDVRDPDEYAVSHLRGAVRSLTEPERSELTAQIRSKVRGQAPNQAQGVIVVFYCTGGARSLQMAEALHLDLIEAGAGGVHVLDGGIIAWANADLPLVNDQGPTRDVHPWDAEMARGLSEPSRIRYEPRR